MPDNTDIERAFEALSKFVNQKVLYALFLSNPYCSDDAIPFHLYESLKDSQSPKFKLFFSYNINVEEIMIAMSNARKDQITILLIDTSEDLEKNIFYEPNINLNDVSVHKAEWNIIGNYAKNYNIPAAKLLIGVDDTGFVGIIKPVSERYQSITTAIINFFTSL